MKRFSIIFHAMVCLMIPLAMSMTIVSEHIPEGSQFTQIISSRTIIDHYEGIDSQRQPSRLLSVFEVGNPAQSPVNKKAIIRQNGAYLQRALNAAFSNDWSILKSEALIQGNNVSCTYTIELNWKCNRKTIYDLTINRTLNSSQINMKGQYKNLLNASNYELNTFKDSSDLPLFESVDVQTRRIMNIPDSEIVKIKQAQFCFPLYSLTYKHQIDESEIKVQLTYDPIINFVNILSRTNAPY